MLQEGEASSDVHAADEGSQAEDLPTSAWHCTAEGLGLKVATVRQHASFKITARDSDGNRRKTGGDQFFVFVRGNSKVRARVRDEGNGSYVVEYCASCSGFYSVTISLFGESLRDSPFTVTVVSPGPDPSQCMLQGGALQAAVARQNHSFEVYFRDALGGVAHAEELDVYVEPLLPNEPEVPSDQQQPQKQKQQQQEQQAQHERKAQHSQQHAGGTLTTRSTSQASNRAGGSTNRSSQPSNRSGVSTNRSANRQKRRVEVQGKPLIVRSGSELDSPQVGMLFPGQLVNVLEERKTEDGIRARVSLVDSDPGTRGVAKHWRSLHPTPFEAVEEEIMRSPRENELASKLMGLPLGSSRHTPGFAVDEFDPSTYSLLSSTTSMMMTPTSPSRMSRLSAMSSSRASAYMQRARSLSPSKVAEISGISPTALLMDFDAPAAPRRRNYSRIVGEIGWVTLEKPSMVDKKLVTRRMRLDVGHRQQHLQQWQRRLRSDRLQQHSNESKSKEVDGASSNMMKSLMKSEMKKLKLKMTSRESRAKELELDSDPEGIGFAYGGIDPGILKSRGQLHSKHMVHYSIGKVGTYQLHVGLRKRAVPLPGSPFTLVVSPGPAHAISTKVPKLTFPLKGTVGTDKDTGCRMTIASSDQMGNACIAGGANMQCWCTSEDVKCRTTDNNDGTYLVEWHSMIAGAFDVSITIDGKHLQGSPTSIRLSSTVPDLSKTELSGPGLTRAIAGRAALVRLKFMDQYSNPTSVTGKFEFAMALVGEKASEKLANAQPHEKWEGKWITEQEEDFYEIRYEASTAGNMLLHMWCMEAGARKALPGSPYAFTVRSGKPVAESSFVDGWSKERAESANNKKFKAKGKNEKGDTAEVDMTLFAGDSIYVRPQLRDAFGNLATLPDGAMTVTHLMPDGMEEALEINSTVRNGLMSYDVRLAPQKAGEHQIFILLQGSPVKGSPVEFEVTPASHDITRCVVRPPPEETMFIETKYEAVLETFDQYGNASTSGGAVVSARLQYVKQGIHDATILNSMNHAVSIEDRHNGKYVISVHLFKIASVKFMDVNLLVNMDRDPKERPNGIDLQPLLLRFWKREEEDVHAGAAPASEPTPTITKPVQRNQLRRQSTDKLGKVAAANDQPVEATTSLQSVSSKPLDATASSQSISSTKSGSSDGGQRFRKTVTISATDSYGSDRKA